MNLKLELILRATLKYTGQEPRDLLNLRKRAPNKKQKDAPILILEILRERVPDKKHHKFKSP